MHGEKDWRIAKRPLKGWAAQRRLLQNETVKKCSCFQKHLPFSMHAVTSRESLAIATNSLECMQQQTGSMQMTNASMSFKPVASFPLAGMLSFAAQLPHDDSYLHAKSVIHQIPKACNSQNSNCKV